MAGIKTVTPFSSCKKEKKNESDGVYMLLSISLYHNLYYIQYIEVDNLKERLKLIEEQLKQEREKNKMNQFIPQQMMMANPMMMYHMMNQMMNPMMNSMRNSIMMNETNNNQLPYAMFNPHDANNLQPKPSLSSTLQQQRPTDHRRVSRKDRTARGKEEN